MTGAEESHPGQLDVAPNEFLCDLKIATLCIVEHGIGEGDVVGLIDVAQRFDFIHDFVCGPKTVTGAFEQG